VHRQAEVPGDGSADHRVGLVDLLVAPGVEPEVNGMETAVGRPHDDRPVVAHPRVVDGERDDLDRIAHQ
jgi:hypothetical protein